MAEQSHTIKYEIDNSQAIQVRQQEIAGAKERAAAERAAVRETAKANADAIRAQAEARREGDRQQTQAVRETQRVIAEAARARTQVERDAARERATAERAASQATINEARNAARIHAQLTRDEVNASRAAARAKQAGFDQSTTSASKLVGGLSSVSSSLFGIGAASDALKLAVSGIDAINAAAEAATTQLIAQKDVLRDIANMGGESGPTNKTVREAAMFRAKTGQTDAGAIGVREGFLNIAQSSIDTPNMKKVIAPEEATKFMEYVGERQAATGEDPRNAGRIAAMILTTERKKRMDAETAIRRTAQIAYIGTQGGADPSQWSKQFGEMASMAETGTFKSSADLAAVAGVYSMGNAAEVRTNVQALVKGTVGGLRDDSKLGGASMSRKDYLAGLNVTDQDAPDEIVVKIAKDYQAKAAEAAKAGQRLPAESFLADRGWSDMHEKAAIRDFIGRMPAYESTFKPASLDSAMPTTAEAMAPLVGHRRTNDGQRQKVEAAAAAQQMAKGATGELPRAVAEAAFQMREARGETWGDVKSYQADSWRGGKSILANESLEQIRSEGIRVGKPWQKPLFDVPGADPFLNKFQRGIVGPIMLDSTASARGVNEAEMEVRAAGGDTVASILKQVLTVSEKQLVVAERNEVKAAGGPNGVRVKGGEVGPQL